MLSLNNLRANGGSRKSSKRVGRGNGSGKGTYSTRGCKGQNSRSGGGVASWFEGGQTPLFRRLPKLKGFSNARFKKHFNIVNLDQIALLASKGITEIDKEVLLENNMISNKKWGVKLLAKGELNVKVTISINKISKLAKETVEKAGGVVNLV